MHFFGTVTQHLDHFGQRHPAIDQGISQLVQHHEEVLTAVDGLSRTSPALTGQLRRVLQVLALPAEAIAQAFDRQVEFFKGAVFTKARAGHLHELKDLDGFASALGANGQAKGGGALAFAIARVDDQQATTLGLLLLLRGVGRWGLNVHLKALLRNDE